MIHELNVLPVPNHFCPIFIDLDPSQFLILNGMLSAVVDVEAYAIGPREFDFVGLEYVLDEVSVASFLKEYSTMTQWNCSRNKEQNCSINDTHSSVETRRGCLFVS